jgi:hypothetical protein
MALLLCASMNAYALTVHTNEIADGAVTTPKIADGAVTDAKISGTISTSKLNVGTTAGTVAPGNHNHDATYQRKYGKVAIVAQTGGDYSDPVAAMNQLATWCGTPMSTNPCLVKVMPGIYDIASNDLQMQEYVDLEGSGEYTTTITGTGGGQNYLNVIAGASNSEIRNLTIDARGGSNSAIAGIFNRGTTPKISNVTIKGNSSNQVGGIVNWDTPSAGTIELNNLKIVLSGAWPTGIETQGNTGSTLMTKMINVDIKVIADDNSVGRGILHSNSDAALKNVNITVVSPVFPGNGGKGVTISGQNQISISGSTIKMEGYTGASSGVYPSANATVKIDNSSIAANWPILNSSSNVFIANSQLDGYVYNWVPGTIKCIGSYDGNYNAITCQ